MDRDEIKINLEAALSEKEINECRTRAIRQEELYVPRSRQERIRDNYLVLLREYRAKR